MPPTSSARPSVLLGMTGKSHHAETGSSSPNTGTVIHHFPVIPAAEAQQRAAGHMEEVIRILDSPQIRLHVETNRWEPRIRGSQKTLRR